MRNISSSSSSSSLSSSSSSSSPADRVEGLEPQPPRPPLGADFILGQDRQPRAQAACVVAVEVAQLRPCLEPFVIRVLIRPRQA